MAKQKEEKTNVMRVLDQKKIPYKPHTYPHGGDEAPDGETVARALGQNPAAVYKTLVTKGASGGHYVFDIPVAASLDLKKAARAVGGEVHRHAAQQRAAAPDRLRPRRMLPSGDEKAVSHGCSTKAVSTRTPSACPQGRWASRWRCARRTSSPWWRLTPPT